MSSIINDTTKYPIVSSETNEWSNKINNKNILLDPSQYNALQHILNTNLSLIQGPPGNKIILFII